MALLKSLMIPHEITPEEALLWFQRSIFTDIPPHFMTHWKTGKKFFYGGDALLAFEETRKYLVMTGEPVVASGADKGELWRSFQQLAKRKGKAVCGYCFGENWQTQDFSKTHVGTSSVINLAEFDLHSPSAKEVRRSLRKGKEFDYNVIPVYQRQREGDQRIDALYQNWIKSKAPFALRYFLSKPQAHNQVSSYEEWFVVEKKGEVLAFCSLLPYLNDGELGFYMDHLLHQPGQDSHALGFLISFLIQVLQEEGVKELNLGLNPFANSQKDEESSWFFKLMYRFPFWYRPRGLHRFKRKFADHEEPQYCFFPQGKRRFAEFLQLARLGVSAAPTKEF